MNREIRKAKLISRNVLEFVAYYSRFNPLYKLSYYKKRAFPHKERLVFIQRNELGNSRSLLGEKQRHDFSPFLGARTIIDD